MPPWRGYLGPRTLTAFVGVLALGLVLYGGGLVTRAATLKGVGLLFVFMGLALTVALILRWPIYRGIG